MFSVVLPSPSAGFTAFGGGARNGILVLASLTAYFTCDRAVNHTVDKAGSVEHGRQDDLVVVRQFASRRQAEQYALVLTAMGVPSSIAPHKTCTGLFVAPEDAARAIAELWAYDRENGERPQGKQPVRLPFPRLEVAMTYWAILLFFFAAARNGAFSYAWVDEGAAQAGLLLEGQWWRAVTALCLHVDVAHLLSNLVFGTVFLVLLSQVLGAGAAGLSMVAAGAAGNVLNAYVHAPAHTSIGASTAIFAAVGLLAALRQVWRLDRGKFSMRDWAPLAGGATLLVFLGLGGGNTDILAHVMGFGCGITAGFVLARRDWDRSSDGPLQWKCAGAAGSLLAAAWIAAAIA